MNCYMKHLVILLIPIFFISFKANSQNKLNQEVKVIKPYEPSISDAFKINELPRLNDTIALTPSFSYSIKTKTKKLESKFKLEPIKAAKMLGEPLNKLYKSYFKLGFGNYTTPLAEINITSLRAKNYSVGAYLKHFSTSGKIKNTKNKKVFAGNSNNFIQLYGKKILKNSKILSGDMSFNSRKIYYYGYNPDKIYLPTETIPTDKKNIEYQNFNLFNVNADFETNYIDSSHVNYDIKLNYKYFTTKDDINENNFSLIANINYFMNNQFLGVDYKLNYINTSGTNDTLNYLMVKFNPWVGAFGKKWRVIAGVNTYYDQKDVKYYFYPRLSLHYNVIDYFLIPYFEVDGKFQVNNYQNIAYENFYITNKLNVKPTNYKQHVVGGIRGNFSSKISFNFNASYSQIDNNYFFVNDTTCLLENKFDVVYDDVKLTQFFTEISYKQSQKLNLLLKAEFFNYVMDKEIEAWHKPKFKIDFKSQYVLRDKIIVNTDIFAISSRYAKTFDNSNNVVKKELSGIFDVNLGLEYRYTKVLSAFVNFNNIGAVKYYQWNNYPLHKFNVLFGLTYSL
ncbi:MAG: TonB-dependent receptor [Bacteroidetes bacterium]|nr:TonB-dependent receptor [Bacteroidota bacterium]